MAKIKNSMLDNVYGDGKEQILTLDNGDSYTIKNSMLDNVHGGGKEKVIIKNNGGSGDDLADFLIEVVPWWVWVIFVGGILILQKIFG